MIRLAPPTSATGPNFRANQPTIENNKEGTSRHIKTTQINLSLKHIQPKMPLITFVVT